MNSMSHMHSIVYHKTEWSSSVIIPFLWVNRVVHKDVSIFGDVEVCIERNILQYCITVMYILCGVSLCLVHHHFASIAQ